MKFLEYSDDAQKNIADMFIAIVEVTMSLTGLYAIDHAASIYLDTEPYFESVEKAIQDRAKSLGFVALRGKRDA